MMITNARIEQVDVHNFIVKGDTERFGQQAVLYQDTTRRAAEDYIRREDPRARWTFHPLAKRFTGKVPEYVQELVKGFEYNYGSNAVPGYTISIRKPRPYMTARVFRALVERMINWANRYGADASVISTPLATRHNATQWAVVTIYDPVMKYLENYR